jgi:hypothetical protein
MKNAEQNFSDTVNSLINNSERGFILLKIQDFYILDRNFRKTQELFPKLAINFRFYRGIY